MTGCVAASQHIGFPLRVSLQSRYTEIAVYMREEGENDREREKSIVVNARILSQLNVCKKGCDRPFEDAAAASESVYHF